jgi:hypothetical protein
MRDIERVRDEGGPCLEQSTFQGWGSTAIVSCVG